jgi:dipeptidyl-peptidase III
MIMRSDYFTIGKEPATVTPHNFNYFVEQFDDIRILKYRLPGFEMLTLRQKVYIYYLSQAALAGRDIFWDQNFRFNMLIRKTLEAVLESYSGDRSTGEFKSFLIYAKKVFFANGIHHHYSGDKFTPGFTAGYLTRLISNTPNEKLPLEGGCSAMQLIEILRPVIFDDKLFARKVEKKEGLDIVASSATNFYEGVSQADVEGYYSSKADTKDSHPVSIGLNSKVIKVNGVVTEEVYKAEGKYGTVIEKIITWLEKAASAAETQLQKKELGVLIDYYKTGDLGKWDEYNVLWAKNSDTEVDYINGFIENYEDPMGIKASWEAIVHYTDKEASIRTKIISENAQWFEDNSPIQPRYRKANVTGIAARVVNIAMLGGASYPSSPLGINLPNANWIRKEVGSKSVTLANIKHANEEASLGNGFLEEYAYDKAEIDRVRKYDSVSDALHTDLHECVGHASGKLAEGTDPNALKSYSSTLEETRADLFALYFIMDKKIIDLGLLPCEDAAKAAYDSYLRNGLLTQIVRIKPGKDIEEAHMRNRALISNWVTEKGKDENVVEYLKVDGKTYVRINDYLKLRNLFGELLKEIQRIKSEGDFSAGKKIVEDYAVKIDPVLHAEVLERYEKLNLAPYTGFVNPVLTPVYDSGGSIKDITAEYTNDYLGQMMHYGKSYSFLSLF